MASPPPAEPVAERDAASVASPSLAHATEEILAGERGRGGSPRGSHGDPRDAVRRGRAGSADKGEPTPDRSAGGHEHPRSRSAIFLWQTDGAQRFTLVSPVLAATVGPATGTIVGRSWREIAERFQLDPDGRVAARFAGERTWNGETVDWPVGDDSERIAIEFSAIPVFDEGHRFAGFRGFGAIRPDRRSAGVAVIPFAAGDDAAAAPEPPARSPEVPTPAVAAAAIEAEAEPLPTEAAERAPATNVAPPPAIAVEPIAEAAQKASRLRRPLRPGPADRRRRHRRRRAEEHRARRRACDPAGRPADQRSRDRPAGGDGGDEACRTGRNPVGTGPGGNPRGAAGDRCAAPEAPEPVIPPASNVVRLPGAPVRALPIERLSGTEQDAFHRIAEALGVKMPEGLREDRRARTAGAAMRRRTPRPGRGGTGYPPPRQAAGRHRGLSRARHPVRQPHAPRLSRLRHAGRVRQGRRRRGDLPRPRPGGDRLSAMPTAFSPPAAATAPIFASRRACMRSPGARRRR